MVTVGALAAAIEEFAPLRLQAEYDNSGLQVGRAERIVRGVLVCLDVSAAVLDEAEAMGCDMVVSHHPLLFGGVKSFCGATQASILAERAIRSDVTLYAAHTNLDFTQGGVSYAMAERLGLESVEPLHTDAAGRKMGVIGSLPAPLQPDELCIMLKSRFESPVVRCSAERRAGSVQRLALCGGSGVDLYGVALRQGAEAFVTADAKYHDFQRGAGEMLLVDIGHRESEWMAVELLARIIRKNFPTFAVYESTRCEGPVLYY